MGLDEIDKLLETGEILPLGNVRQYIGVFTGKMVRPVEDFKEDLTQFNKGDQVLVMHLKDYAKFHKGMDMIREDNKRSRKEWEDYKRKKGWD